MSIKNSPPKVAVFYDWLNQWGGAERVLLDILQIFPNSDLHTLVYNPSQTHWLPKNHQIYPSLLNHFPKASQNPIFYTPFYTPIIRQLDFSQYDIVISTTSTIGHQLPVSPHQLFICYFHNINRYLYQIPPTLLKPLLKIYQRLDYHFAQKPNSLLCNSKAVQQRIKKHYHRDAQIISPGIDTSKFIPAPHPKSLHFLIVSRLVSHKNIDLAIRACQSLNLPLKIVGTGRQEKYLRSISLPTTEFLGSVSETKLLNLYQNCSALLYPQEEDFGLTCLEAQSSGKPVIAYQRGGATETIIPQKTGIFFQKLTLDSLTTALKSFKPSDFNPQTCRQQASKFSRQLFMLNFKKTVNQLWHLHHPIS